MKIVAVAEYFDPYNRDNKVSKMKIDEWFDPYNPDHMIAYRELCETGRWPMYFLPLGLDSEYDPAWQVKLVAKMADAWISYMHGLSVEQRVETAEILEDLKSGQTDNPLPLLQQERVEDQK